MEQRTRDALEASIAKWERNAVVDAPKDAMVLRRHCRLCDLFYKNNCCGCPVSERTGAPDCGETSYESAFFIFLDWRKHSDSTQLREKFRAAALAEVEFLKSLRPAT